MLQSIIDSSSVKPDQLWIQQQRQKTLSDRLDVLQENPINMGVISLYQDDHGPVYYPVDRPEDGIFNYTKELYDSARYRQKNEIMTMAGEMNALGSAPINGREAEKMPKVVMSQSGMVSSLRYRFKIGGDFTEDPEIGNPFKWGQKNPRYIQRHVTPQKITNYYAEAMGTTKEESKIIVQNRVNESSLLETGNLPKYFYEMRGPIPNIPDVTAPRTPPMEIPQFTSYSEYAFL